MHRLLLINGAALAIALLRYMAAVMTANAAKLLLDYALDGLT